MDNAVKRSLVNMRKTRLRLAQATVAFALTGLLSVTSMAQLSSYNLTGSSSDLGNGCFQLTPNAPTQVGTVWANEIMDLEQAFHMQALMNFGNNDSGADGIVFVLQDVGPDAQGVSGGGLGFGGFSPSFGVEFDTYYNSQNGDLVQDHIGMISDGIVVHPPLSPTGIAGPVTATPNGGNIEDGQDHIVDIIWDPSIQEMKVFFDCTERLVASIDLINDIFAGDRFVWWGFTASTGGAQNAQTVCLAPNALGTDAELFVCPEASVQLVAGGIGVTDYNWSPDSVVSDGTIYNPEYTGVVSNTLTVEYTDQCGQLQSDVVQVNVEDVSVTIVSDGNTLNCANGGFLNLVAESNFGTALTYEWSVNNSVVGDLISLDVTDAGSVTVEAVYPGTSSLACQSEDQLVVSWDTTAMTIDAGPPGYVTCAESVVELLGTVEDPDNASIQWTTTNGSLEGSTTEVTGMASSMGTYTMTVVDNTNGCVATDEVEVGEDLESPEVTLGAAAEGLSCINPFTSIVGTQVFPEEYTPIYSWTDPLGNVYQTSSEIFTANYPGMYGLQITFVENGCTTAVEDSVEVVADELFYVDLTNLRLPNVMTPGDRYTENDKFRPVLPELPSLNVLTILDEYDISVFNRWGELMFQNDGSPLQWDGRAGGEFLSSGSYIVTVRYLSTCGGEQTGQLRSPLEIIRPN